MLLLTHILIALSSLGFATYALLRPSSAKFNGSYALIAATLGSGTILALADMSHLVQACMSGITYLTVVTILTTVAHRRYAVEHVRVK